MTWFGGPPSTFLTLIFTKADLSCSDEKVENFTQLINLKQFASREQNLDGGNYYIFADFVHNPNTSQVK